MSSPVRHDTQVPVVVLDIGYSGLGIARSLGRMGIAAYGVNAQSTAAALASRYWKGTFTWDFSSAPPAESVRFLQEVSRRIGRRAVLIPTSDTTTMFVAENADALDEGFIFPRQPAALVRSLVDKQEMYRLAGSLAMATPSTVFPRSRADVDAFVEGASFPVIAKGIDPRLPGGTTKVIFHGPDDVLRHYDSVAGSATPNLVLQEYIPGDDDTVWMFNGYFDERSHCLAAFTGQKLRQYPPHVGVTSLGVCLRNDQVDQMTRRFLSRIGYRGPVDVDYRYDPRDGSYKILDVNPRIGATFRLFVDEHGLDVARIYYLDSTRQAVPSAVPREGRRWMLEEDVQSCLRYRRDGKLSLRAWAGSLRGVQEAAWFALDDPAPFLIRTWGGLRNALGMGTIRSDTRPAGPRTVRGSADRSRVHRSRVP